MIEKKRDMLRDIVRMLGMSISKESISDIADTMEMARLRHRSVVLNKGDVCGHLFFLQKGLIRQFCVDAEGNEVTADLICENNFFTSEKSFFSQTPSEYTIQTLEPSFIYAFRYDKLQELMTVSVDACRLYNELLQHLLERSLKYAEILRSGNAGERYECLLRENPDVVHRSPMKHIASYLQVRQETLSRIRGRK